MAKELAFEQIFWDSGAVDVDERLLCAISVIVDTLRHNAFPSAALSCKHNRGRNIFYLIDRFFDF